MWSLGATIFYVLSGRTPYEMGDNVMGGLYRIVHDEPPRLAEAGWLAPLLDATMVKDPSRRWSMAQVRDFLAAGPSGSRAAADPGAAGGDAPGRGGDRHPVAGRRRSGCPAGPGGA